MNYAIDPAALKVVNLVLKKHDIKIVKGQNSKTRYLVQRKWDTVRKVYHKRPGPSSSVGRAVTWYTIGIAYGEWVMSLFENPALKHEGDRTDGWYMREPYKGEEGKSYLPPKLSDEELQALEVVLTKGLTRGE